jgi:putative peptidoglycan lipid II flippase
LSATPDSNTPPGEEQRFDTVLLPDELSIGATIEPTPPQPVSTIYNLQSTIPLERSIASAAFIIMLGNILSRVMGLVREQVVAGLYGGSSTTDSLTIASNVSTITYDLLISGIVSAALVPVFSEYAAKEKREELWRVASSVLSIATVGLGALIGAMMLFAPQLTGLMASKFSASQLDFTAALVLIVLPGVIFLGVSAVLMSLLYALQRFAFPAFAPVILNLSVVALGWLLYRKDNPFGIVLGMSVGALLMVALQWFGLRDVRLRFRLDWRHPGVRKIGRLYLPVALGLLVTEAGLVIDRNLASGTGAGGLSAMRFATTLVQFALGLVSAAISLAVLPSISRSAASGDLAGYKRTLGSALRLVIALILPASFALAFLGVPIIQVVFQHGAFSEADKWRTAIALLCYAVGTPFAAVDQVLLFAFYARQNTRTPVLIGIGSVLAYLVVAILLTVIGPFSFAGLALADSAKQTFHAVVSFMLLGAAIAGLRGLGLGATTLKAGLAALLAALVGFSVWLVVGDLFGTGLLGRIMVLLVSAGGFTAAYLGAAALLRLNELAMVWGLVARRLALHWN